MYVIGVCVPQESAVMLWSWIGGLTMYRWPPIHREVPNPRHFPKVHKNLSHTYYNDPRVNHDYMFFTCILTNFLTYIL